MIELTPDQREAECLDELAKIERDQEVVDRIAGRVAKGQGGNRRDRRVELHVDIEDVALLVRLARSSIVGRRRLLDKRLLNSHKAGPT